MRIIANARLGGRYFHHLHQLDGPLFGGGHIHALVEQQWLSELSKNRENRIEGCHRVLEYDRERAAAQSTKAFGLKTHEILPIEQHAPRQFGFFRQQLQDRARQHGFSAARFPDNSKGAAGADSQTYLIDRAKIAARGRQIDRDIFDGK